MKVSITCSLFDALEVAASFRVNKTAFVGIVGEEGSLQEFAPHSSLHKSG